jgi:hypothetical protein
LATALSHCLKPSEGFDETMKEPRSSVQSNREEASSEQKPQIDGIKDADLDGVETDGIDEKMDGEEKAKRILLVDDNQVNLKVSNSANRSDLCLIGVDCRNVGQGRRVRARLCRERTGSAGKVQKDQIRRGSDG